MISFIANTIGKWQLNRKVAELDRVPMNVDLNTIKKVRIVFYIENEQAYLEMVKVAQKLSAQNWGKVETVAFFPDKEVPEYVNADLVTPIGFKDFGISGMPSSHGVKNILKQEVDIVLDFTLHSFVPVDVILALSKTRLCVGRGNTVKEYMYDLIINVDETVTNFDLLGQMVNYIGMVNKSNN